MDLLIEIPGAMRPCQQKTNNPLKKVISEISCGQQRAFVRGRMKNITNLIVTHRFPQPRECIRSHPPAIINVD